MSDMGRKVVPDKGRLNRERLVTEAPEFPSCTGKSFSSELDAFFEVWDYCRNHRQ